MGCALADIKTSSKGRMMMTVCFQCKGPRKCRIQDDGCILGEVVEKEGWDWKEIFKGFEGTRNGRFYKLGDVWVFTLLLVKQYKVTIYMYNTYDIYDHMYYTHIWYIHNTYDHIYIIYITINKRKHGMKWQKKKNPTNRS